MIKLQIESRKAQPFYGFTTNQEDFKKGRRTHEINNHLVERCRKADYEWRWLQSFLKGLR